MATFIWGAYLNPCGRRKAFSAVACRVTGSRVLAADPEPLVPALVA